jgi:hypothetical protein
VSYGTTWPDGGKRILGSSARLADRNRTGWLFCKLALLLRQISRALGTGGLGGSAAPCLCKLVWMCFGLGFWSDHKQTQWSASLQFLNLDAGSPLEMCNDLKSIVFNIECR